MSGAIDRERRFSEKEMALILKRAAELQHREPLAPAEGGGLSLAELEQIAAEAGIDPRHVREAAASIATEPATPGWSVLLGAPTVIVLERSLDGEVAAAAFEELVETVHGVLGATGQAGTLGRTLTWHSTDFQRFVQVTVSPRGGRTTIRIEERLSGLAGGLFGGIMGGVGGGVGGPAIGVLGGALGSVPLGVGVAAAAVVGSYLLARGIFRSVARKRSRQLRQLLDQLADRAAAAKPR